MARLVDAWDRPRVDLELLDEVLGVEGGEPPLERLLARLPLGLVHAEAVLLTLEPPPGFSPLAAESAWSAAGQMLAVVERDDPERIVRDLGAYRRWAAKLRRRLEGAPGLVKVLCEGRAGPEERLVLGKHLDLDSQTLSVLEQRGALRDLGWMAVRPFGPEIRVEPRLRPGAERARGEQAGTALAARLCTTGVSVLALEDPIGLDLLSPYVRDLGHALSAWGLENAARLRTRGLADALSGTRRTPDADLASLVACELLETERDRGLLEERRAAERTQGLWIEDQDRLAVGHAHLDRLASADACLEGAMGDVALVAGPSAFAVEGVVGALLDSGQVGSMALVGLAEVEGERPVVPRALVTPEDGFALPGSDRLLEVALELGIETGVAELLHYEQMPEKSAWIARIAGRARREMVRRRLSPDVGMWVLVCPSKATNSTPHVTIRRTALAASRVALSTLVFPRESRHLDGRFGVIPSTNRPSPRRFRA